MPPSRNSKTGEYTKALWEKALLSEKGIKIPFNDEATAIRVRFDCYNARTIMRQTSKEIHSKDSPDYDRSPYDGIKISLKKPNGVDDKYLLVFESTLTPPLDDLEVIEL